MSPLGTTPSLLLHPELIFSRNPLPPSRTPPRGANSDPQTACYLPRLTRNRIHPPQVIEVVDSTPLRTPEPLGRILPTPKALEKWWTLIEAHTDSNMELQRLCLTPASSSDDFWIVPASSRVSAAWGFTPEVKGDKKLLSINQSLLHPRCVLIIYVCFFDLIDWPLSQRPSLKACKAAGWISFRDFIL